MESWGRHSRPKPGTAGVTGYSQVMIPNPVAALGRLLDESTSAQGRGKRAYGFYWTRKSSELARELIAFFTRPGSVILDPFLGSGTTGLGCVSAEGRRLFVGVEINELPIQSLLATLVPDLVMDRTDFQKAKSALDEVLSLYRFEMSEGIVELEKIIHNQTDAGLVPTEFIVRESNGAQNSFTESKTPKQFAELLGLYNLRTSNFPKRDASALATNSRIAVKPGMLVSDVFGPMGFEALCRFKEIGKGSMVFRLILAGSVHLTRLTDAKSQSQFPFWFPKQDIHEKSAYGVLSKRLGELGDLLNSLEFAEPKVIETFSQWDKSQNSSVRLIHGSTITDLKEMEDESVDFILTDPPYFDQVAYSEYLKLWEYFTDFSADLDREIVESSRVDAGKTRGKFLEDLKSAFIEVRRVTKTGSFALVYFKDSKPKNLHDFITILGFAGFSYLGQKHLAKASFTYKQNATTETTVGGDSLMIFVATDDSFVEPSSTKSLEELDGEFLSRFSDYVRDNGPSSLTEALDNALIASMYRTGYLAKISNSRHLVEVVSLKFRFEPSSRKWYPR